VLALIIIFLSTLIIAATVVSLYRLVSNWRGFNKLIAGILENTTRIKPQVQRGFETLTASSRGDAKHKELRSPKGGIKSPWGTKSHQTPRNLAQTHAAKPIEQTPWAWRGHKQHQVRKQRTHNARHSSLNDAPSADPASIRSQNVGWPYREDMMKTGGKGYKITRKVPPPKKTNLKTLNKPWGW
jgi:hypothetical protein